MIDTETDWVANRRPIVAPPDPESTKAVRQMLLEHAETRPAVRHRRPVRRLAALLVPASALAAVAIFVTGTDGGAPGVGPAGVSSAEAALPTLAEHLRAEPKLVGGDATLVVREQSYPGTGKDPIIGYDLYADDGKYYYAASRAGLPEAVAAGPPPDSGSLGRVIAAGAAGFRGDIETARTRMIDAVLEPGQEYLPMAREQRSDPDWQDHWVWGNSYDALVGGAGRPEVRAGVLHLLDSVADVTVEEVSVGGRPALRLTAAVFDDDYVEELTIDADTGVPLRFVGGAPDKPDVVIRYRVSRVTLDELTR